MEMEWSRFRGRGLRLCLRSYLSGGEESDGDCGGEDAWRGTQLVFRRGSGGRLRGGFRFVGLQLRGGFGVRWSEAGECRAVRLRLRRSCCGWRRRRRECAVILGDFGVGGGELLECGKTFVVIAGLGLADGVGESERGRGIEFGFDGLEGGERVFVILQQKITEAERDVRGGDRQDARRCSA